VIPNSGLRFSEKVHAQTGIPPDFAVLKRRRML